MGWLHACALISFMVVPAASTGTSKVVIMPIELVGAEEAAAQEILDALRSSVAANQSLYELTAVGMTLDEARMTFSCFDDSPACMAEMGKRFGADLLIWGTLTAEASGKRRLDLHMVNVAESMLERSQTYEAKSGESLESILANARLFVQPDAAQPVLVTIDSQPSGIRVFIDGAPQRDKRTHKKVTPIEVDLLPSQYELAFEVAPGKLVTRKLDVMDKPVSITEVLDIPYPTVPEPPIPEPIAGEDDESKESTPVGLYIGIGAGIVAVGSGVVALTSGLRVSALQDEAATTDANDSGRSELESEFEEKKLITNIFIMVGGVAAITSASLLIVYYDYEDGRAAIAPSANGFVFRAEF